MAAARWYEQETCRISRDHMAAFAAAVGESETRLLRGDAMTATYPIVLGWESQEAVIADLVPAGALGLHGEQAFTYHRPIEPGTTIRGRSRVHSVLPTRSGSKVAILTEVLDSTGICNTQLCTLVVVGHQIDPIGAPSQPLDSIESGPVLDVIVESVSQDQPDRYAAASGDAYAIHLDDDFARSQGLPRRIVHGMSTLAYAARAVRRSIAARPSQLRRLAARFSAPVFPGDEVSTRVRGQVGRKGASLGFVSSTSAETVVLTHGQATVDWL